MRRVSGHSQSVAHKETHKILVKNSRIVYLVSMNTQTPHPGAEALRQALKKVGGMQKLADLIGGKTRSNTVSNWIVRGVPLERCPVIEKLTGIPCEELRPDVDWKIFREVLCVPKRTGGSGPKKGDKLARAS